MCSVFSLNYTVAHASTTEATVLLARFTSGPETIEKPESIRGGNRKLMLGHVCLIAQQLLHINAALIGSM